MDYRDDMVLDDLDISIRLANTLDCAGIKTLGDILDMSMSDLLRIKNFGRRARTELLKMLDLYGKGINEHKPLRLAMQGSLPMEEKQRFFVKYVSRDGLSTFEEWKKEPAAKTIRRAYFPYGYREYEFLEYERRGCTSDVISVFFEKLERLARDEKE